MYGTPKPLSNAFTIPLFVPAPEYHKRFRLAKYVELRKERKRREEKGALTCIHFNEM